VRGNNGSTIGKIREARRFGVKDFHSDAGAGKPGSTVRRKVRIFPWAQTEWSTKRSPAIAHSSLFHRTGHSPFEERKRTAQELQNRSAFLGTLIAHDGLFRALLEKGIVHHILWAACPTDQTGADANIAGGCHGAFTYYFCKEMNASNNSLSRAQVLAKVRSDLSAGQHSQTPQLECEATNRQLVVCVKFSKKEVR
jgi:hypothetical protein